MKYIFAYYLSKYIQLKNIFFLPLILYCIICSITVSAQNCLDKINQNSLYSKSNDIINGRKWQYEKRFLGSPLLMENYWPKADISFNGFIYTGILMNYDIYKNEFIIFHPEKGKEKYVVINIENLSGFSFTDTVSNRKYSYEYIKMPGTKGKALFQNASVGRLSFFIKPIKIIEGRSADKRQGEFFDFYEYYIDIGKGYSSFRSKKQFIKLLATHSTELNRFIRKYNLKINNQHPENIITVINYLNGLN